MSPRAEAILEAIVSGHVTDLPHLDFFGRGLPLTVADVLDALRGEMVPAIKAGAEAETEARKMERKIADLEDERDELEDERDDLEKEVEELEEKIAALKGAL